MTRIEIRDSLPNDVRLLMNDIRENDRKESLGLGIDPYKALFWGFRRAAYRKTALVDGKIAAMWGVVGELLGKTGRPYFITSNQIERASHIRIVKIYKNEVKQMLKLFPVLENYVDADYLQSIKLLRMCGFFVDDPQSFGFKGNSYCRFSITESDIA